VRELQNAELGFTAEEVDRLIEKNLNYRREPWSGT
jgi:hypothetical protein